MSIDIAIEELHRRRVEQAAAEQDGSWEAYAEMKQKWGRRRREIGWTRSKMRAWLDVAERQS